MAWVSLLPFSLLRSAKPEEPPPEEPEENTAGEGEGD
jgi:hypothetical protein